MPGVYLARISAAGRSPPVSRLTAARDGVSRTGTAIEGFGVSRNQEPSSPDGQKLRLHRRHFSIATGRGLFACRARNRPLPAVAADRFLRVTPGVVAPASSHRSPPSWKSFSSLAGAQGVQFCSL